MVSWRQRVRDLEKQIQILTKENIELKKRLLAYENAHTPPSLQKKKRPPKKESSKRLGAPKGHPKWERKEPRVTGSVEYVEKKCPHCKSKLGMPYKTDRIIVEEIPEPQPIEVIEHLVNHYKCSHCGKKVTAKNKVPSVRFGKNALSHITLLKYDDRLPLRKVTQSLKRHYGLTLTHVGVYKVTGHVAKKLKMPYYEVIRRIRSSRVIYVDETKYKLNGETWWLWTFVSEHDTLFVIRKSRASIVIEEILGKQFRGIISCDGWTAYTTFSDTLQRCWAHLLRETKKMAEDNSEFEGFHASISKLFDKIQELRGDPPPRLERIVHAEKLRLKLKQIAQQMQRYTQFRKLARKILNGLKYWFTCVVQTFVEPTNNFAEHALRELIVQRKIMGGLKSEKGAHIMEIVTSLLASWKKQNKPVFQTMKSFL